MPLLNFNKYDKYIWTNHSHYKMRHYRLSESLVKRVIRYPARTEEGIVPDTVAVMRPSQSKKYSEVWVMYVITNSKIKMQNVKSHTKLQNLKLTQLKIITAWRYPGLSPKRNPIPKEILEEVRNIIGS